MRIAIVAALLLVIGCASAYDETYAKETEMLEQQEQARQAQEAAAHAEARKYAAVAYFDVNSAAIRDDGFRELDWFVKQMQPYPQAIIQVQGFADSTGTETLNQQLSDQRAEAVARYLSTQGIDPSRIRTEGFASEYAAKPNLTAEGRQRNRRVEVTVR
jgi:outer membrane protein OmpA-like peptidoglycan-associated protein